MKADLHREKLIYQYLLGDLSEEQKVEIEDRAFSDPTFQKVVTAVESDLIDDYVRGELSDIERHQFELRFLVSSDRRRRIEFAKAFSAISQKEVSAAQVQPTASNKFLLGEYIAAFINGLSPVARFASAAAIVVMVAIAGWRIAQPKRQSQLATGNQERPIIARPDEAQPIDDRNNRGAQLASQAHDTLHKPSAQPSGKTTVTLALIAGISRGSENRPKLLVPNSARRARLKVGLDREENYEKYRVELRDQSGTQIFSKDLRSRTTRSEKNLDLTVPVKLLSNGRYELTVKGLSDQNVSEVISYHYFDVLKK